MTINELHSESWTCSQPKGNILFVHGYPEHFGRHQKTIKFLADQGWNVFAYDQRWHGKSPGRQGYADVGQLMIEGGQMAQKIRQEYPDLPLIAFGHSLGAIIVTSIGLNRPDLLEGVVMTAGGFLPFPVMPSWMRELVSKLATFVPNLPAAKMKVDAICHDPAVVETVKQDPHYFHGYVPMVAAGTMVVQGQSVLERCRGFSLPALLIHGLDDQIADIQGSRKFAAEAGLNLPVEQRPQVELIEVEHAYHEVLNEVDSPRLYAEIAHWLDLFQVVRDPA